MIALAPLLCKILVPRAVFVTQFENEYSDFSPSLCLRIFLRLIRVVTGRRNVDYVLATLLWASHRIIVLSGRHMLKLSEHASGVQEKSILIPPPPILSIYPEHNGASREHARQLLGVKANEFIIVHFGYVYRSKGIDVLLKAFKILCRRKTNVRLLTVGGEPAASANPLYVQQLKELVKETGLENKIIQTGDFSWDSNLASLYLRAGDTCVLPFISGVSLNRSSVAAAAAHGLPIITTEGPSLESAFVDHKNVLLCRPNDEKALAEAIESLIADAQLRKRLGAGAAELADRWFSWDKALEGTIEALGLPHKKGIQ
jgi:glycosyltransferase involved in cell wall biosynthesis